MNKFGPGEMVRTVEPKKYSEKIYIIKKIKKIRKGGHLYLLKSLGEDRVLRLYYDNNDSMLERISS